MKTVGILAAITLATSVAQAQVYKIGGILFDEANTVKSAAIVEGPVTLPDQSSPRFGRYSENYIASLQSSVNEFVKFNRKLSVGWLMGRSSQSDLARHVSFPEPTKNDSGMVALPNIHRCSIELTWNDQGLPNNGKGDDFVIFESGSWEGFAVAVKKANDDEYSAYRYHFPKSFDATHNVNPVTFDLTDFGLAENDVVASIRVRNLFNGFARAGGDKVTDQSGQGWVIYPGDPRYKNGFPLRSRADGAEFKTDQLGADIMYVAAMQDLVSLKKSSSAAATSQDAAKK